MEGLHGHGSHYQKDVKTLVSFFSTKLSTIWPWMVPHSCLEKADGRTWKKHSMKFRHKGYNVDPYGQSFFPKSISAWNGLAQEIADADTLDLFKSKWAH